GDARQGRAADGLRPPRLSRLRPARRGAAQGRPVDGQEARVARPRDQGRGRRPARPRRAASGTGAQDERRVLRRGRPARRRLGHPLHAVLTDAPIGILFLVIVFDVLSMPDAADWALIVGILTMLGAALAGFADYADTDGKARERATLHSSLMLLALVGYLVSL